MSYSDPPQEGLPALLVAALYIGKCRDLKIPLNAERQRRFVEQVSRDCTDLWFNLPEAGIGAETARALAVTVMLNDQFAALSLGKNQLQDEGVAILAQVLRAHQTMTHLDFSTNAVGTPGAVELFTALETNRSITSVDLSSAAGLHRNHIGPRGAAPLAQTLKVNGVITRLVLSSNGLGLQGAQALAEGISGGVGSLTYLDVSSNDFGQAGAQALASCLAVSAIETLLMGDNALTDAGCVAVADKLPEAKALRMLDLQLNDLT